MKKNLSSRTTFKIGGEAREVLEIKSKEMLEKEVLKGGDFLIIGRGSNTLFPDEKISKRVLVVKKGKISLLKDWQEEVLVEAEAGVFLPDFSKFNIKEGLKGMEWASGVPGSVGGAIYGNAGAFGENISDNIIQVEVIGKEGKKILKKEEIDFGYRESIFKRENLVILSGTFLFKKGKKEEIKEKSEKFLNYRKENHPLNYPSAGSVFKNPQIKIEDKDLLKDYKELEEFNEKGVIPAGYLIEKCNLKGKSIGGAQVSLKHANFIINKGGASFKDVKELIELIKEEVEKKFGVSLEEEIRYLS